MFITPKSCKVSINITIKGNRTRILTDQDPLILSTLEVASNASEGLSMRLLRVMTEAGTLVNSNLKAPLFLAQVADPQGFIFTVADQVADLEEATGEKIELTILDKLPSPAQQLPPSSGIYMWVHQGVAAMAPQIQQLWKLDSAMQGYEGTRLAGAPFVRVF